MLLYALKKAFFDLWDRLFFSLAVNFLFTALVMGLAVLLQALPLALTAVVLFSAALLLQGMVSFWAKDLAVSGSVRWGDALKHFLASWKTSVVTALAWVLLAAGYVVGIPFYNNLNVYFGLGFGAVLFWLAFFLVGMSMYLPGLQAQVGGTIKSFARKSFVLLIAHPLLSFLLFLFTILFIALSVVTLGFFPGVIGIHLWLQVGFRFLLARYEWLEKHPEHDRKKPLPWREVLVEDLDRLGPRTLRGLIFPWKD